MSQANEVAEGFLQQARSHLKDDFMPKIRRCLDELSETDVWWRPHEATNSVGNLLLHLAGNVRQWVISSLGGATDRRQRPQEFAERTPISKEELWAGLEKTIREADAILADFPRDRLLEKRFIQKYETNVLQAVFHVVEHFSYHTGQIVYVTKSRREMDLKLYDL
jgi:uncharacterized damage-inducible protein DinB